MLSMSARLSLVALCVAAFCGCPGTQPPPSSTNTPPVLTLVSPLSGQQVRAGKAVALAAQVQDAEEGEALGEHILWVSSRSGQLARGARASATFSGPGEQTLTASVTDSGGLTASASFTLVVLDANAPSSAIAQPAAGATFNLGEVFGLACEALTAQGAALTGDSVRWTSALSGPLPSGPSVRAALSVAGEDTLTCTATDAGTGLSSSASVHVTVRPIRAPTVRVTRPEVPTLFVKAGEPAPYAPTVTFTATAQDFQAAGGPGNLDAALQWTLQPGGVSLGTGPSVTYTFTTPGAYTVTASATDSLGNRAEHAVQVRLVTNLPPACGMTRPRDDSGHVLLNAPTPLEGWCVDPETGTTVDPVWTTSADAQPLGTGPSVSAVFKVGGTQRLSACAQDPDDASLVGCAESTVRALPNTAPQGCNILSPQGNDAVPAGTPVTLEGTAADSEDPQSTLRYAWTSSRDGDLTSGAKATTRRLVTGGQHTLTLTVTDPWGASCTATANVRVNGVSKVDSLAVKQVGTDCLKQSCRNNADVDASGTVSDAPEGIATIEWLDGIAGGFGMAAHALLPSPVTGKHTLVLRVTDTSGAVGRAAATITVLPNSGTKLVTSLFDTGQPVAALAVLGADDVRYVDGAASVVSGYPSTANNVPVGGPALALFQLTGTSGSVLFVGTGNGVERCAAGTCSPFSGGPLATANNRVNAIAALESPDLLLLGTDKGLVLTRASSPAASPRPGVVVGQRLLDGIKVRQVLVSPASTATQVKAWAATSEGLAELTIPVGGTFEPAFAQVSLFLHVPPSVPGEDVLSLAMSPEGRVFAGTSKGLSALGEEGPALRAAPWNLPDDVVQALLFERTGTGASARDLLWVGTRSGLVRYDVTQDIPTRFGAADGLPGEDIRSLGMAPDGTRYIGTARGLATYSGP